MYAIVDIETTGGHASANGITEIAIILHDGKKLEGRYSTLINPMMPIPRYVSTLTGINDAMVASAPLFEEVAENIHRLLKDRIFVAHNVNFDYSFIRHQMNAAGFPVDLRKLCTVRLGRKIFKGLQSYSLGNLCRALDIPIENRHRASGDATATMLLFEKLLKADTGGEIQKMLKQGSRESYLPLQLNANDIADLPNAPGVYYFTDIKDNVIYVGKAINLRKRVTSHFSNNSPSRRKQELMRNVCRIKYEECGSEFSASVFESIEIRRLWPRYNYSQKKWEHRYGLFAYEDQRGIIQLAIERKRKNFQPLYTFNLLVEGHQMLRKLIRDFSLCPKYCFLQKSGDCAGMEDGHCKGVCCGHENAAEYNERVRSALLHLKNNLPSLAILEKGRTPGEHCCVLLEEGEFYGMGYLKADQLVNEKQVLKELLTPYPGNELIKMMILKHAGMYPQKVVVFSKQ